MSAEPAYVNGIARARTCRNCDAPAPGEYCAACGQETRLQLPTARVFMREATGRYFSFDGRMWRTLAALLFRPGFLTREYLLGRRRRYIRPARLFLVLSLALFAAIRFFAGAPILVTDDVVSNADSTGADIAKDIARDLAKDISKDIAKDISKEITKSPAQAMLKFDEGENGGDLFNIPGFTMHVDRDFNLDLQDANLPWTKDLKRRLEHFNKLNRQEKSEQVFLGVVRYGPYAMFVLMPAFALLQLVAYFGRGRRYPDRPKRYAEHLVFAAHTHAFLFLVGVLALSIPVAPVRVALGVWCVLYGLWATKRVYRGRWSGLLLRGYVVGVAYITLFALAIIGLLLVAVLVR